MAIIRTNKGQATGTRGFTKLARGFIEGEEGAQRLSLGAIGLLGVSLSHPDKWNYSLAGICENLKEQKGAVRTLLKELQEKHYFFRRKVLDACKRFRGYAYHFFESFRLFSTAATKPHYHANTRNTKRYRYLMVDNESLLDENLSLTARGLLLYMLSRPDDWKFSEYWLAQKCQVGRTRVVNALRQLEENHYLLRRRVWKNGRIVGTEWIVYENKHLYGQDPADLVADAVDGPENAAVVVTKTGKPSRLIKQTIGNVVEKVKSVLTPSVPPEPDTHSLTVPVEMSERVRWDLDTLITDFEIYAPKVYLSRPSAELREVAWYQYCVTQNLGRAFYHREFHDSAGISQQIKLFLTKTTGIDAYQPDGSPRPFFLNGQPVPLSTIRTAILQLVPADLWDMREDIITASNRSIVPIAHMDAYILKTIFNRLEQRKKRNAWS